MRQAYRLYYIVSLCLLGTGAVGQRADSLRTRLQVLERERRIHALKDTDYLRGVDSIVPFLVQEDSLPEWLGDYRDIAFGDPRPNRHKAFYYTYLALNAYNTRKLGSAIYYSEKNNEERIAAGLFEKGGLSHSDMFALLVYYNNHDYVRVERKYLSLAPILKGTPAAAAAGKLSVEQAFVGLSILQVAEFSYCRTGNMVKMKEAFETARNLLEKMRDADGKYLRAYAGAGSRFDYLGHSINYKERICDHRSSEAARLLWAAIEDVRDTSFPARMRADYISGLYTEAIEFYTDQHKSDSISKYLQLLHGIGANAQLSTTDTVFLAASDGFLLGDEGRFEEAYRELKKAYLLRDSAYYSVASDRDNNLYALAEADNARAEMLRSEEKKRKAEQSNLYLFFLLSLLIMGGGIIFIVSRWRQRQRLLNLQLGLARNFHDAVGPMLLYANALVKKEMDEPSGERLTELKTHIGRIMDEVRGIAHDLKSSHLGTIDDLGKESTGMLEKMREATGIDFNQKTENGERFLTHMQHSHLGHIIRELIGNSVKHAGCGRINLEIRVAGHMLQLYYSDDGKGMDPTAQGTGIGLQNIRERVVALNGSYTLKNAWPEGYLILIEIPLRGTGVSPHERDERGVTYNERDVKTI